VSQFFSFLQQILQLLLCFCKFEDVGARSFPARHTYNARFIARILRVTELRLQKDVHKPSTSGVQPLLAKTTNGNRVRTTETAKVSDKVRTGGNAPKETQIKSNTGASACQAPNGSASLSIKIDGRNLKRRSRSPTSIKVSSTRLCQWRARTATRSDTFVAPRALSLHSYSYHRRRPINVTAHVLSKSVRSRSIRRVCGWALCCCEADSRRSMAPVCALRSGRRAGFFRCAMLKEEFDGAVKRVRPPGLDAVDGRYLCFRVL
jgi:hypothetical protein